MLTACIWWLGRSVGLPRMLFSKRLFVWLLEDRLPENVFAWLVTVARNEVYQEHRKRSRRRRHERVGERALVDAAR